MTRSYRVRLCPRRQRSITLSQGGRLKRSSSKTICRGYSNSERTVIPMLFLWSSANLSSIGSTDARDRLWAQVDSSPGGEMVIDNSDGSCNSMI